MTITWGVYTTCPNPSTFDASDDFVGGTAIMADGSMAIDLIARKQRIQLGWQGLTKLEANSIYAQALNYNPAVMDLTNIGGENYGEVIPTPGSARWSVSGGALSGLGYDVSAEVRTVDPLTLIEVSEGDLLALSATADTLGGEI